MSWGRRVAARGGGRHPLTCTTVTAVTRRVGRACRLGSLRGSIHGSHVVTLSNTEMAPPPGGSLRRPFFLYKREWAERVPERVPERGTAGTHSPSLDVSLTVFDASLTRPPSTLRDLSCERREQRTHRSQVVHMVPRRRVAALPRCGAFRDRWAAELSGWEVAIDLEALGTRSREALGTRSVVTHPRYTFVTNL